MQYPTGETGKTTSVFIPISAWNRLKSKYEEVSEQSAIPKFHKEIVRERIKEYDNNDAFDLNFDNVIAKLEKD